MAIGLVDVVWLASLQMLVFLYLLQSRSKPHYANQNTWNWWLSQVTTGERRESRVTNAQKARKLVLLLVV